MDRDKLADALRRAAETEEAAAPAVRQALQETAKAIEDLTSEFRKQAERIEKDLRRGASLTRHRITL